MREFGIELPHAPEPVADYLAVKRSGSLLFVSGRVSPQRGAVDTELSFDAAREAAAHTARLLLAIVAAEFGDLDHVVSVEAVRGFVRSAPTFTRQPEVIDGASAVFEAVFGEAGRHARTATGAAQLPFGAAVQLDAILRTRWGPQRIASRMIRRAA